MALPKIKKFSDYNKYITDKDYTTSAKAQEYFSNQGELLTAIINNYWQPETNYVFDDIVYSPSFGKALEAVCVKAGKSSTAEPNWGSAGSEVLDGTAKWRLRYKNGFKNGKAYGSTRTRSGKPTYGL